MLTNRLGLLRAASLSDEAVERAALRNALGYDYIADRIIKTREGEAVRRVKVHVPPDVGALKLLLRARIPEFYGPQANASNDPFVEYLTKFTKLQEMELRASLMKRRASPLDEAARNEEPLEDAVFRVAHVMSRLWASDDEIAAALDLSPADFNKLRHRHPELAEAIKAGKEWTDALLEQALTRRAVGYSYYAENIVCTREGDIRRELLLTRVPGDSKAEEIWIAAQEARSRQIGKKEKGC